MADRAPNIHRSRVGERRQITERAVRPLGVVVAPPFLELDPRLGERGEQRFVQELIAQAAIEAFDESILLRLAWIDVVPCETEALRPAEHRQAVELGAIVRGALLGQPSLLDHALQRTLTAWLPTPPGRHTSPSTCRMLRC